MRTITPRLGHPLARIGTRLFGTGSAAPSGTSEPVVVPDAVAPQRSVGGTNVSPKRSADSQAPSGDSIWVTVLVENSVQGRQLQAEHGLAFSIHTHRWRVLFDTGQSNLILRNASTLGVPLDDIEAIALSHGHYDHTGGLSELRQIARKSRLFLHPGALAPKFSGQPDSTARAVGMSPNLAQNLRCGGDSVVWTRKPTEVVDGVFVTGEIPRETPFEDTGGRFFLDEECRKPDPLLDDQAMFFDTADGVVVLLGCAHAGVVNTLRFVRQLTGQRPLQAVLGGFHLLMADEDRMQRTLAALGELDVQAIGAAHCTGQPALARLWTAFPNRCCTCAVGSVMVFRR